jgi:CHAD domain-containing protein
MVFVLNFKLNPLMPADMAVKSIYSQLLLIIKDNQLGVIDASDSEHLHDFRVAVRKTRSALTQLKSALPKNINTHYREFFSWLGKATSPRRDLDVYLMSFAQNKSQLSPSMQQALQPLDALLLIKHQQAQLDLITQLNSDYYVQQLSAWSDYLQSPSIKKSNVTIKKLASQRINKIYQQVLTQGSQIVATSHNEQLHELRKTCKKLRYLLEFFQNFYAASKVKILLKQLKALQDVLGEFQDACCQEQYLVDCREELAVANTDAITLEAIDYLIEDVIKRHLIIREQFAEKFAAFKTIKGDEFFK